jgi:periplasmic protein TonB
MNNDARFMHPEDRLDAAVDQFLASRGEGFVLPSVMAAATRGASDPEVAGLLPIVGELALLPTTDFKSRLALDLEAKAASSRKPDSRSLQAAADMLPTLFRGGMPKAPVSRMNVAASFIVHMMVLSLLLSSTYFVAEKRGLVPQNMVDLVAREIYTLPAADTARGGGGGGDRSRLEASHGALPKASHQQITPPSVEVKNPNAKLEVEPTVIVPLNIQPQKMVDIGDPTARPMILSNGTGANGGIGTGSRSGVGPGDGRGFGPGNEAGLGGGLYKVGSGIAPPRQIYAPDPDYSEEARKMKHQGSVVLWMVVGTDGRPRNIRVQRSLGMGLDEKAIEAVKTWRFDPAKKDGQPVNVQINVEVYFRLY